MATMLQDNLILGGHAPMIHDASRMDHEKSCRPSRCISMHTCGSDPIVMVLQWVALRTTRTLPQKLKQLFRVHFVFDVSKTYCLNIIIRPLSTSFWRQGWSWIIVHLINKASLLYGAVKSVQQLPSSLVLSCLWRMPKNWYSCLLHPILSDI